ncbi:hypothetical protein HO133_010326 [Letharia lupina]|uniref:NAD(P)-binding protein n=1 Tax=Letharia lupina TaxID=560253 RepID=A0A8H6CKQ4_9LECA|nr:uncharacterized protein HO133_010326 [Letharia lupina]KAF6225130.1 hypothetical protein HO133_010326 [Letharia lupina]
MTGIDTDVREVQKMFNVNVFGPMRMVHHFHPMLIKARGTIVNIGSVGGIVPYMYGCKSFMLGRTEAKQDVKVTTIISGNIGTNILKSDTARTLPEGSFYAPLAREFQEHVQRVPDTTPRAVYAGHVVPQTLKANPPAWYWVGATTGIVRFMDIFGFRTVWDYILWPVFNLGKLRQETEVWRRGNE